MAARLCPVLLLLVLVSYHSISAFDMVDCAIGGVAGTADCSNQLKKDLDHYKKPYCCIVAKFQYCLTRELGDSCGSGIKTIVDKTMSGIVFNEGSGCKDYTFISPECIMFYYWPYAAVIGGIILLTLSSILVIYILRNVLMCTGWLIRISCRACAGCCCPSCLPVNKYQRQFDLDQHVSSVVIRGGAPVPFRVIPNISHSVNGEFRVIKDETPLVPV